MVSGDAELNKSGLEHSIRRPRMGMTSVSGSGQILQVPGSGFVVRSTGRKDRHSKVFTAKGLRDRRVRLSAHTAIRFYDVQDRLGYDRPSKAVDWLIRKAKSAIDKLSELPPCNPNPIEIDVVAEESESSRYNDFLFRSQLGENLISPSLDSAGGLQSNRNLGLSLQTVHEPAGSGNSGLGFDDGFDKIVEWNSNGFGSDPILNQSFAAFQQRGPLQSSLGSPALEFTWNGISVASAGKSHLIPVHEQSSPSGTRFVSGGLPHLDVHGRFESDGDGDGGKVLSRSSSYSRR